MGPVPPRAASAVASRGALGRIVAALPLAAQVSGAARESRVDFGAPAVIVWATARFRPSAGASSKGESDMRAHRFVVATAVAAVFLAPLAAPRPASAQTLQTCLVSQLRYAGTACRGLGRCYMKALRKGFPVDSACLAERQAELESRYANTESLGDCLVEPAGTDVANMLVSAVAAWDSAVSTSPDRCGSKKMGALGRECKQLFRCYEKSVNDVVAVDPTCVDKASAKQLKIFTRVEEKMPFTCDTTGDAAALDADVQQAADDVYSYVRGTGTTTTTTTITLASSTTTTLVSGTCPTDGSVVPCEAYRDIPACTSCVDGVGGVPQDQCAAAGPTCANAFQNQGCGFAINTSTSCGAVCCP